MKSKYLKVFIISLLGCCIAIGDIHSYQTKNHEAQKDFSNENTDILFVEEDHISGIEILFADGSNSVTDEMYEIKHQYAENTPDGVRMVDINSNYSSGRLFYTVKSARLVTSVDEMQVPLSGFSHDARLYKDEENNWIEGTQPKWIKEDGTFDTGTYLILLDVVLENDNAAMVTDDDPNSRYYSDPYYFRIDGLLSLFDMNRPTKFRMMDYFSEMGEIGTDLESEFIVCLQPGESITCTVGFVVEDKWLANSSDLSQLSICNTQGIANSVFLNLGLELE